MIFIIFKKALLSKPYTHSGHPPAAMDYIFEADTLLDTESKEKTFNLTPSYFL